MGNEIIPFSRSGLPDTRPPEETDERLIDLWVHGRSPATVRAYRADAARLLAFAGKPLAGVTLSDIQSFADALDRTLAPASKHRCLSAVKSLFAFAARSDVLRIDLAQPLKLPALRDRLAERILSEDEVRRLLDRERHPRDHVILSLLYPTAIRVSECCGRK